MARAYDWEKAELLEPRLAPREPVLISDGGGLAFPPGVLDMAPAPLDPDDPVVAALVEKIAHDRAQSTPKSAWWRRSAPAGGGQPAPIPAGPPSLAGWRLLARTDDEALFGIGQPPRLLTAIIRPNGPRGRWLCIGVNKQRPLRAARNAVRASSWRLDPDSELADDATELRILVNEQSLAGGLRADGRFEAPDLHVNDEEMWLRIFVTPREGFQVRTPNPETAVRVALPEPLGDRALIDGALYEPPGTGASAGAA